MVPKQLKNLLIRRKTLFHVIVLPAREDKFLVFKIFLVLGKIKMETPNKISVCLK